MALIALTSPVSIDQLRNNFDDKTAALAANMLAGRKDQWRTFRKTTLADTDALRTRTTAWTQVDDQEVRTAFLRVTDAAAPRVVTWTLSVDGDDTRFLVDKDVSISVTTIVGTADERIDLRTATGDRIRLKRGVRYRMTIENTSAGTTTGVVMCGIGLRTLRRTK